MIATGQISIIDYNDALTLTGFISSNNQRLSSITRITGIYNPDWSESNLIPNSVSVYPGEQR